jgi:hypothetical protein
LLHEALFSNNSYFFHNKRLIFYDEKFIF